MDVRQAKARAKEWVEVNRGEWSGFRAAHLVGGITAMADEAPFPAGKDVDLHLILAEGSPALTPTTPVAGVIEAPFAGLPIEAGFKSEAAYASPEAVLSNPEIAYHLTVESVLVDDAGWLAGLQAAVRRDYRRCRWVRARIEHERAGLAGALAMRSFAGAAWGAPGEVNVLGYTTTFMAAALAVATLGPPRMGNRMLVHLADLLAGLGRADLHEEVLAVLGVRDADRATAERLLSEGAEVFDLAVQIERRPGPFIPFEHKLHGHLRSYFVDACRAMIAEGHHREALAWTSPFFLASTEVVLVDGPEELRPFFAARRDGLLHDLGFDRPEAVAAGFERANRVAERVFALAEGIVAGHPDVID
jgi:hypothetical protein